MTQTEDREARALEAAVKAYTPHPSDWRPGMRAAIAAYNAVMREGRPETTLEELLYRVHYGEDSQGNGCDPYEARAAIHDLFQEARNGK